MLWAWLMFGDPVTIPALIGLAVCALAVALVHTRDPAPRPARSSYEAADS
jgi:drug/metabolite transporter (DMT)-like permease